MKMRHVVDRGETAEALKYLLAKSHRYVIFT